MEDYTAYWLVFRGFRHYSGLLLNTKYRKAKGEWKRNPANRCWECYLCGRTIKKKDRTIDHIIPANIIWETEVLPLLYDPRNFAAAHALCNSNRGDLTIADLPPRIRDKLLALRKN